MRLAANDLERWYEELALRDSFYQRYGWTSSEFDATPQREIDHLPAVWRAKEAAKERRDLGRDTAAKARAMALEATKGRR